MTVDFLLAKLKTLTTSEEIAWKGVEDDLRALERTTIKRCADRASKLFGHPPLARQVADEILATSPGKKPELDQERISKILGSTMIEGKGPAPPFGRFGIQQHVARRRNPEDTSLDKVEPR